MLRTKNFTMRWEWWALSRSPWAGEISAISDGRIGCKVVAKNIQQNSIRMGEVYSMTKTMTHDHGVFYTVPMTPENMTPVN